MESFSISDVIIITGVTKPVLERWLRQGYLRTIMDEVPASPEEWVFNRADIYTVAFLMKLSNVGFSRKAAVEKINIRSLCRTLENYPSIKKVAIAFSRVMEEGAVTTQGGWIIAPEIDRETHWESLALIERRLDTGADDFYILNFIKLKSEVDHTISQLLEGRP